MLNIASAAVPSVAGFGAGAFPCPDAGAASLLLANLLPANPLLASPKNEVAASEKAASRLAGAANQTSVFQIVQVDSVQRDSHNFIQTARLYPATRGGLGPHPAREPEPV